MKEKVEIPEGHEEIEYVKYGGSWDPRSTFFYVLLLLIGSLIAGYFISGGKATLEYKAWREVQEMQEQLDTYQVHLAEIVNVYGENAATWPEPVLEEYEVLLGRLQNGITEFIQKCNSVTTRYPPIPGNLSCELR